VPVAARVLQRRARRDVLAASAVRRQRGPRRAVVHRLCRSTGGPARQRQRRATRPGVRLELIVGPACVCRHRRQRPGLPWQLLGRVGVERRTHDGVVGRPVARPVQNHRGGTLRQAQLERFVLSLPTNGSESRADDRSLQIGSRAALSSFRTARRSRSARSPTMALRRSSRSAATSSRSRSG